MTSILDTIVAQKKIEVEALVLETFNDTPPLMRRSFYEALLHPNRNLGVIAEVKKGSPSKGILVKDFDPVAIGRIYEKIGADAISVLTDELFFHGHHTFLTEIKKQTNLPVLRKDFIIDEKQIFEAKKIGADAILLIAAILDKYQIKDFMSLAEELQLDVLMEVHDEAEVEKVLSQVKPKILGVNNRNLKTFETSLEVSKRLSSFIPEDTLFISESGIKTKEDILYLKELQVDALLVGEGLVVEKDKQELLTHWFEETDDYATTP
ncbi:MAG: indole-3-glycerol phosphate synthase TrpC [Bacillus sp. (in: Bacteria)]|nr:indole-3-glycerol phosphate synthase TrpC [Bacillus sp. (in: firmicutes)]